MKSLHKQIILSLLLILTLACSKEITDDLFDYFEVSATHDENAFLASPQPTDFTISEINNNEETYSLSYTITEGEGYYVNNGVNITPNDTITINNTEFSLGFVGKEIGVNNAQITIRDRNGRTKTIARRYIVTDPGFSFEAIPSSTTLYDKETTPISINIKGAENQTYTTQYKFNANNTGTGTITLNDKAIAENTNIPTTQNSFNLDFTATASGTAAIQFTATSPSGIAIQKTITFTVQKLDDFIFKATRNNTNEVIVDGQEIINFNIEEFKENQTFTMTYSSSNTGVLTYLDKEYAPGASIPISKGSSVGSYKGTIAGVHELTFIVSNEQEEPIQLTQNLEVSFKNVIGIPPTITLNGDANITLILGQNYAEQGATASDSEDGNIAIIINGIVNTNIAETYIVTYTATDSDGNVITATRTVTVDTAPDTTKPVITRIGNQNINITLGQSYNDQGATATDDVDGNITAEIITTGTVNTNQVGTYTITYNVNDNAGNAAIPVTRNVIVDAIPDTTKPVITRIGNQNINITLGQSYNDQGATATDDIDGNITAEIITTGTVNTNKIGTYTINYNVNDNAGNAANQVTRTVVVNPITIPIPDKTPPIITLKGGDETINLGSRYEDKGATAIDNVDGDITDKIRRTGTVDSNTVGTYTINYNVTDNAGNSAETVTRTVSVIKDIP